MSNKTILDAIEHLSVFNSKGIELEIIKLEKQQDKIINELIEEGETLNDVKDEQKLCHISILTRTLKEVRLFLVEAKKIKDTTPPYLRKPRPFNPSKSEKTAGSNVIEPDVNLSDAGRPVEPINGEQAVEPDNGGQAAESVVVKQSAELSVVGRTSPRSPGLGGKVFECCYNVLKVYNACITLSAHRNLEDLDKTDFLKCNCPNKGMHTLRLCSNLIGHKNGCTNKVCSFDHSNEELIGIACDEESLYHQIEKSKLELKSLPNISYSNFYKV